ncbi:MAG: hypothetical protein CMJ72_14785 [Planctomycetaceae bacterium]|nr:hypothetical protein [Planctomycetaceae bacterium]
MFSRLLGAPVLLAAAVGVPYMATQETNLDASWDSKPSQADISANGSDLPKLSPELTQQPQGPSNPIYATTTPLEGVRSMSLSEIFRFDISKEWVYQRWARKSTALAELGLFGIRVPLVSGTRLQDLAGSLTYYFDSNGLLQRISFYGNTGDTTGLVMLVVNRYGFQRQATPIASEQLYQIRNETQVFSELHTRPAPVLWANAPHKSFTVELELQRPGSSEPLLAQNARHPPEAAQPAHQTPAEVAQQSPPPEEEQAAENEEKPGWKTFFPRSRVPRQQVESLDKRDRYW